MSLQPVHEFSINTCEVLGVVTSFCAADPNNRHAIYGMSAPLLQEL